MTMHYVMARLMGCGLASCAMRINYRLNENEKRFIQNSTCTQLVTLSIPYILARWCFQGGIPSRHFSENLYVFRNPEKNQLGRKWGKT
jgi:hypothetical protein